MAGASTARVFRSCAKCGGQRPNSASICPSCQRKRNMKSAIGLVVVAEIALGFWFAASHPGRVSLANLFEGRPASQGAASSAPAPGSTGSGVQLASQTSSSGPGWYFYSAPDETGAAVRHARLVSTPPAPASAQTMPQAEGIIAGTLDLSDSGPHARAVTVSFPRIKTACDRKLCAVRAIFDETQPMNFSFSDVSDDLSTILRLHEYDRFVQRLSVSHDLTIIAALGAGHAAILNFGVDGFTKAQSAQLHLRSVKLVALAMN